VLERPELSLSARRTEHLCAERLQNVQVPLAWLPCQSHYFITENKVVWVPKWTGKQIAGGRAQEAREKERYYAETQPPVAAGETLSASPLARTKPKESLWQKIKNLFS